MGQNLTGLRLTFVGISQVALRISIVSFEQDKWADNASNMCGSNPTSIESSRTEVDPIRPAPFSCANCPVASTCSS
jgi:hypothetical protein